MLIKICGIKTLSAAKAATEAGADFIGFNFVPTSGRYITPVRAHSIIKETDLHKVKKGHRSVIVGVFQNQPLEYVNKTDWKLRLDYVQLHGDESPEYCAQIKAPIIKAFNLDSDFDVQAVTNDMKKYKAVFYLLDRKGREGEPLNFKKVAELAEKFPIILAGGLTPENVATAVAASGPIKAVDVAGGVETNGEKDLQKIRRFIEKVR